MATNFYADGPGDMIVHVISSNAIDVYKTPQYFVNKVPNIAEIIISEIRKSGKQATVEVHSDRDSETITATVDTKVSPVDIADNVSDCADKHAEVTFSNLIADITDRRIVIPNSVFMRMPEMPKNDTTMYDPYTISTVRHDASGYTISNGTTTSANTGAIRNLENQVVGEIRSVEQAPHGETSYAKGYVPSVSVATVLDKLVRVPMEKFDQYNAELDKAKKLYPGIENFVVKDMDLTPEEKGYITNVAEEAGLQTNPVLVFSIHDLSVHPINQNRNVTLL